MPVKGQLIVNPRSGEYIEFLDTCADTHGALVHARLLYKAGGFRPTMHMHFLQDEKFHVLEGELTYVIGDQQGLLKAGESITMPKAVFHTHYNAGQTDLVLTQTLTPGLDFDLIAENFFGLQGEGKTPNGQPQLLQVLVWLRSMKAKTYISKIPRWSQDLLAFVGAPVARLLGYKAVYQRFSGYDA